MLSLALAIVVAGSLLTFSIREWRRSRRLRVLAMTDELTRLANRRRIMLAAEEAFAVAHRQQEPLTILMFDIDHFKRVNDSYGHDRGDLVLKRVANASKRSLRSADRIGRVGGEEFMVVLPQTGRRQAEQVGRRIQAELAGESWSDVDAALSVTVSIGIALAGPADTDVADVMRNADLALYQAKNSGRNRIEFHEGGLTALYDAKQIKKRRAPRGVPQGRKKWVRTRSPGAFACTSTPAAASATSRRCCSTASTSSSTGPPSARRWPTCRSTTARSPAEGKRFEKFRGVVVGKTLESWREVRQRHRHWLPPSSTTLVRMAPGRYHFAQLEIGDYDFVF